MKLDRRAVAVSFAVTLAGLALGLWQAAGLAGVLAGYAARERPCRSAAAGTLLAWLLVILFQLAATPAGRVAGALGSALLGPAGLPLLVLASLLLGLALAAAGALVGRSLRRVLSRGAA